MNTVENSIHRARLRARLYFLPLVRWKIKLQGESPVEALKLARGWIAEKLDIDLADADLDKMDQEQLDQVYQVCKEFTHIPVTKT